MLTRRKKVRLGDFFSVKGANGLALVEGVGASYSAEAQALFARFTTPPTEQRKVLINNFIVSLIAAGVWAKLDALYVMAAETSQAARQNWIANQYNMTAVGGPVFTADRGYAGDGAGAYLDTGFNPTVAPSPLYVLNSASFGFWSRTASQSNASDMGAQTGGFARIAARSNLDTAQGRNNRAVTGAIANADGTGDYLSNRTGAAGAELFKNDAGATVNTTSVSVPAANFLLLSESGTFSARQLSHGWIGGGLTPPERAARYSAILTYLQAVGAA